MKTILIAPTLALTFLCCSIAFAQNGASVNWQPMPLVSAEALKMPGVTIGGEGSQWPRGAPAVSVSEPNFLLLPIDVGGLYRSLDGGKLWRPALTGWNARGANGFAIDPKNANRVIGIGGNSGDWNSLWGQSPHGLYISTDKAGSWKQTLAVPDGRAGQVIYDPTSFDKTKGFCTVAYYSSGQRGLFRTDDGGATWKGISRLAANESGGALEAAMLAVHPTKGTLYLAGKSGLFVSSDKGETFVKSAETERTKDIAGLSVSPAAPDKVWISNLAGISVSSDGGKTFTAIQSSGVTRDADAPIKEINVSPTDPTRMLMWVQNANWNWIRYISHDGGKSFKPIQLEQGINGRGAGLPNATIAGGPQFLPYNARQGNFTWHPTDKNIAWGLGGDWVTKTTDGGQNFLWSSNGYTGIMIGSSFNFDANNPDAIFLAAQDYNGAFSNDGGKSWNYRDVSGQGWGGHDYGAGRSGNVMWCGDSEGWGTPKRTRISRDGGETWEFAKDAAGAICEWTGSNISYTDPKNPDIIFASNWRSTDRGATWKAMDGCDSVYTHASDGRLFGKNDKALVSSKDSGATWEKIVEVENGFDDVAFDSKREKWYFASYGEMKSWDKTGWKTLDIPKDQKGNIKCGTVAVDPNQPDVVYGGGSANIYKTSATVYRSRDAGATWENLTRGDGPHEVQWIRVHPKTGDAWLNGQCYGMWRIARPTVLGAADPKMGDSPLQEPVKDGETPALARADGRPEIAKIIRDFGPGGAEYTFGPAWKNGENVTATEDSLRFDTNEAGGAGLVLGGINIAPFGETHLAIRARLLPGNEAPRINAKVIRDGQEASEVSFDLTKLSQTNWTTLYLPLGAGTFDNVPQIQFQGTNFGGGAALRLDIDAIGTAKLAPGAPLVVDEGAAPVLKLPAVYEKLAPVPDPNITQIIRDFGGSGLDYSFGPAWKNGENIKTVDGAVQFYTTLAGGAGMVLNGTNIAPRGQNQIVLRARALPGNQAKTLNVNIMRDEDKGGKKEIGFDLSGLKETEWTTLAMPLGEGDFSKINQIQLQGTDWSPESPAFKIQIDLIGTNSADAKANAQAREALANDPLASPPARALPKVAGWGFYPAYPTAWMGRHDGFLERTKQGREKKDINIMFWGDSITQGWGDTGKAVFDENYAPLGAVNYGIGGDTTRQLLWRLENGEVEGLHPKLVVLKIGTNNLYGDFNAGSDEEIADGIKTVVETLQKKLPKTKVLLLGILPRQNDYFSGRARNINSQIAKLDNGQTVRFLDMSDAFQTELGQVKPELYNDDKLHLAARGYELWASRMAPLFAEMTK